nr:alpha-L-rhamnosidase N-terminal domain-containing protein [Armatimonadota bacterium]
MNIVRYTRRELLMLAGAASVSDGLGRRNRAASLPPMPPGRSRGAALQKAMIWASSPGPANAHFVAFRKMFTLPNTPRKALLHLFADVRYLLWINGRYVTRGPARFCPNGPEYDTVPITAFLKAGVNTFAVLVMANASNGKMMHHAPGLTARLEAGEVAVLGTDASWRWSNQTRYGPPEVDWGNVHDRIDARVEDGDWTLPGYDDTHWQTAVSVDGGQWGTLTPRRIPLLRETPLPAKFNGGLTLPVTLTAGQEVSFDLGRLAQAYTTLDLDADADTTLTLAHAGIPYAARAGRQTYLSSDTCSFQKATLRVNTGRVTLHEFGAVERLYPFDCVGRFRSSDPLLNDIWAMCARSMQLMSEDAYDDCADRERTEWMDCDPPGFDITRAAFAGPGPDGGRVYADPRLLEELLRRTALTLQPEGWVKAHTCSDRFDIHALMEDRACDWVQGVRRYYESAQKPEVIREIWPAVVSQMDWFLKRRTARGLVRAREWVVWGNPMGYQTCEGAGLNAFVYKALIDAAYLGRVIGENAQAAQFVQAAKALSTALNAVLWDESAGTYFSGFYAEGDKNTSALKVENGLAEPTMFPALWALDQDIVPAARRTRVTQYLLAHRQQASRMMTIYYLFKQLYAQQEVALDREVLDTIRAKWRDMAETGWKISWEEFGGGSKAH